MVEDAKDYLSPTKMSKGIVAAALRAAKRSAEQVERFAQRSGYTSIYHHDRANWNLDEQLARGLGRQANATV